uniref:Craniofacial development protein 2-like n=1 Tax=Nicotiana sylvestris TaxID=4096 RepID=A0A1U7WUI0_NICSY|nr:PREDICTED: craniofacial development protein 2-like [Nicotiana sylvestris]
MLIVQALRQIHLAIRPVGVPDHSLRPPRPIAYSVCPGDGWVGSRARDMYGYKLWYSRVRKGKNGVGILVDGKLRESVVDVRRVNDRLMTIKLAVGEYNLNIVSAYAPHAGLDKEVPPTKRLFIGKDFNGHIGSTTGGYREVHGGFDFGERNGGGTSLLDFAKAFGLVIANSSFPKREEHLVNFQNVVAKTQIDYLLLKRSDRGLCKDCKVVLLQKLYTILEIGGTVQRGEEGSLHGVY